MTRRSMPIPRCPWHCTKCFSIIHVPLTQIGNTVSEKLQIVAVACSMEYSYDIRTLKFRSIENSEKAGIAISDDQGRRIFLC